MVVCRSGGNVTAPGLLGGGHGWESRRHVRLRRRRCAVGVLVDAVPGGRALPEAVGMAAPARV
jgi:hypothetical protein